MTSVGCRTFTFTYEQVCAIEALLKRNRNSIAAVYKCIHDQWPNPANTEDIVQLIEDIKDGRKSARKLFPDIYEP